MSTDMTAQKLVRRFTERIAEQVVEDADNGRASSSLKTVVAIDYRTSEQQMKSHVYWESWFEPREPSTRTEERQYVLSDQAQKLNAAWKDFQDKLPEKEKASFENRASTFQDVIQTMQQVEADWEQSKQGKLSTVRSYYKKCCIAIKSHEKLLSVLPADSEYCSLFSGVLKSIVHATANHERIAASFSKALLELSETVSQCEEALKFYNTERMQEYLMDVYAHVFMFLQSVLAWYMSSRWKRVVKSFNEDLYDEVQEQLREIAHKARFIRDDGMKQGQSAELRVTRLRQETMMQKIANLEQEIRSQRDDAQRARDEEWRRKLADRDEQIARQGFLLEKWVANTANPLKELLKYQADGLIEKREEMDLLRAIELGRRARSLSPAGLTAIESTEERSYTRNEVLASSRDLDLYFDRARVRIPFDPLSVRLPEIASNSLQEWMRSRQSCIVSIAGPEELHRIGSTQISQMASSIVDYSDAADIPVISYFCDTLIPRASIREKRETFQTLAVTALVYALIRQTIELWPPESSSTEDLTDSRFSTLDGSFDTIREAIRMLDTVLQHAPPMVYCIIDGLQLLESRETEWALRGILKLLKRWIERDAKPKVLLKVLITTSGRSRTLLQCLSHKELILADEGHIMSSGLSQTLML